MEGIVLLEVELFAEFLDLWCDKISKGIWKETITC